MRSIRKKINLLVVIDHGGYQGKIAGVGRNLSYTLPHLDTTRFNIVLAILRDDGSLKKRLEDTGIKVIHLKRKKFDPRTLYDLIKIIKKEKTDLLHLYQYASSNFGRIAGRLTGIPSILHAGDLNYEYPWYQGIADHFLKTITDHVIAISESAKASCIKVRGIDPDKITVIQNAASRDHLNLLTVHDRREIQRKLGIPETCNIVGTVTRLHAVKGNDILLQAADMVLKVLPDTYFVIVGDGPLRQELTDSAKKMGIDGHVIFAGYQENVADFLSVFDVKVMASNTEGFSLALLEAMIMGKAIVATKVGGMREILVAGVTALMVPPRNPEAMAQKIIHLLFHPEEREKLGAGAFEKSSNYSIERHIRMREKVYEDITCF